MPAGLFPETDLCNPEGPKYAQLSEPEPVDGGPSRTATYAVTATNELGQIFTLTYTGASKEDQQVSDLASSTKVCLEAKQADEPSEPPPSPPSSLADMVTEAFLSRSPKESIDDLANYRDEQRAQDRPVTLASIAAHFGLSTAEMSSVANDAATKAEEVYKDVPRSVVERAVETIINQPDAPFLASSTELPDSDSAQIDVVRQGNAFIIDVDLQDPPTADGDIAINYYFDPRIGNGTRHYFRAKCKRRAYVALHSDKGAMEVYLWIKPPKQRYDLGQRYASSKWIPNPRPIWHSGIAGRRLSYDILVRGLKNGSVYHLNGSWILGSGGRC